MGKKLNDDKHFVFVLMGDGEQQEGQVWEAATPEGTLARAGVRRPKVLCGLAREVADRRIALEPTVDAPRVRARLLELGLPTAAVEVIAVRVLRDPDALRAARAARSSRVGGTTRSAARARPARRSHGDGSRTRFEVIGRSMVTTSTVIPQAFARSTMSAERAGSIQC